MAGCIEIPIMLMMFTLLISATVVMNQLMYLTCSVTLGYNETECAMLGSGSHNPNITKLEKLVQPHAAVISMTMDVVSYVMNTIVCLFLGAWSDKFGRKPILLSSLIGHFCGFVALSLITVIPNISPWFLLLPGLFTILGGWSSFLSSCFSYITDITTDDNRGTRIGVLEATVTLGAMLGSLSSSYIFNATNYIAVYAICGLIALVGLLYTKLFIPESLASITTQGSIKDVFATRHIKDMISTMSKQREHYNRVVLFCIVFMLTLFMFVCNDSTLLFLFVRRKFHWSLQKYTFFSSSASIVWMCGTFVSVYLLHKKLRIPESVMLLVGFLSFLDGCLLYGLASSEWHMYAGGVVRLLGGGVSPMGRSLLSKIVSSEEIGKIFSFIVTLETLSGSMSSPLYTYVYNTTINYNPGAIFLLSSGLIILNIFVTIVIILYRTKQASYNNGPILLVNEEDE